MSFPNDQDYRNDYPENRGLNDGSAATAYNGQNIEQGPQRREGYTMITPNERKREKMAQQAQREEENYRKFKESRTPKTFSYVGTVGGEPSESTSPTGLARGRGAQTPTTPSRPFGAKATYKQSVRQKEEEEIAKKKEDARRKTELNKSRDVERRQKLDDDRRLKNEAFLARFDKKKPPPAKVEDAVPQNNDDDQGAVASPRAPNNSNSLSQLTQKYPSLDPEALKEILSSVDDDVERAIALLTGDT